MVRLMAVILVLGASGSVWAQRKPCEDLKGEIEAKIKKNGVDKFSLEVVDASADTKDAKVVGTCDGGAKKIVYKRG
jgi:hypothetical protein